jgi:anti-sigma-K factor RskA
VESGIHELSAGYALDALDADERRRFEEHLAECDRCREDVSAFWEVTGALAVAAPSAEPRPELRERILATARAEGQNVIPLAPRRERRRQFLVPAVAAVAAAAAAVAIGLGLYSASLSNDLDDARQAVALLSDPDAEVVALQEGRGRLVVRPDGDAALVLAGLPARPDKTYAVWVIEGETPQPAGLFDDAADATVVQVERPVPDGAVVAVTVEDGPVDAPTSTPIVASAPA